MTYLSDLVDKINGVNVNLTASDLYMFAKVLSDAKVTTVPVTFVKAVRARLLNAGTTDPNELAYLLKTMNFLNASAIQGFFKNPSDTTVKCIGNVPCSPPLSYSDLLMPTNAVVYSTVGTHSFTAMYSSIPSWYLDSTVLRVRAWGGGGAGGAGSADPQSGAGGGGGGGYAESLVTWGQIKASPSLTVGAGGTSTGQARTGNSGGASSAFGQLTASGGSGGGYGNSYITYNEFGDPDGYNPVTVNGGNGGGGSGQYWATGGAGGSCYVPSPSSTSIAAAGGGSAAGPWGNGRTGGSGSGHTQGGHGGAGTGSNGTVAGSAQGGLGGASAAYLTEWMTAFLQTNLGGSPVASVNDATLRTGGVGCGGSGQWYHASRLYQPGNGGVFGGGGGTCGGTGSTGYRTGGAGGIGAGGGGGQGQSCQGGPGGSGLIIVEFFV